MVKVGNFLKRVCQFISDFLFALSDFFDLEPEDEDEETRIFCGVDWGVGEDRAVVTLVEYHPEDKSFHVIDCQEIVKPETED